MPKYQFLFLNQIQASHHHIKYTGILNCAGWKVTRENLEFLVKHVFLQQYRNINTAFVPDNSKKIDQQEPNGNLLCSLHYLTVWTCTYFQVIKQTCPGLIIKWFQFLGIDFGWPPTEEKWEHSASSDRL